MKELDNYSVQYIKGVGEKRATLFNKLGIFTLDDLVHYYPRKYQDWSNTYTVTTAPENEAVAIKATMITPVKESLIRKGLTLYKCNFSDGENVINVTIFNNKYLAGSLRTFDDYNLYGKLERNFTRAQMNSPQIEKLDASTGIHPIYSATDRLNSRAIAKVVKAALEKVELFPETLDDEIKSKYNLCSLDYALRQIHFPSDMKAVEKARRRLIFEELLTLQIGLLKLKDKKSADNELKIGKDYSDEFYSLLPFEPTNAQINAVNDCINDMKSENAMNRLIQGDVGSGKTAVAGAVIYTAIKNGYQAAMMAPTEILAFQHYESFKSSLRARELHLHFLPAQRRQVKRSQ